MELDKYRRAKGTQQIVHARDHVVLRAFRIDLYQVQPLKTFSPCDFIERERWHVNPLIRILVIKT